MNCNGVSQNSKNCNGLDQENPKIKSYGTSMSGFNPIVRPCSVVGLNAELQRASESITYLYYNGTLQITLGPPSKISPAESLQPLYTQKNVHRKSSPLKSKATKHFS